MKILIVETSKIREGTTIAHVRNSIILHEYLSKNNYCVLTDLTQYADVTMQWDIILFSYASAHADYTAISEVVRYQANARVGWITNEIELFANTYVKNTMDFMINNFSSLGVKKAHRYEDLLTVNLNTLIAKPRNPKIPKTYGLIYYGTYRKYRVGYFTQFLQGSVVLSTSKRNWSKFEKLGLKCAYIDKLQWASGVEDLNKYQTSLYIEDTKTHTHFNYMANRFFEALYCNTAMFFDKSCLNTLSKDKYIIDPYFIVDSHDELMMKMGTVEDTMIEKMLSVNTEIALIEKEKTLSNIEQYLQTLIKKG